MIIAAAGLVPQVEATNITEFPRYLIYSLTGDGDEGQRPADLRENRTSMNFKFDLDYHMSKVQSCMLVLLVSILIAI